MEFSEVHPTGTENYRFSEEMRENEQMKTLKDFLCWYNIEHVVPILEVMQKMVSFHHNKGIDMLKFGCTLPNLADIYLHKPTSAKFYPLKESDKDLLEKNREDMVCGTSIVFTRKAVADQTPTRKLSNLCN